MKLFKLHSIILLVLALPCLLFPLSLWLPPTILPHFLGGFAVLYIMLWFLHALTTSFLIGLLLFIGRTPRLVIFIHVVTFIVIFFYTIFLFSS